MQYEPFGAGHVMPGASCFRNVGCRGTRGMSVRMNKRTKKSQSEQALSAEVVTEGHDRVLEKACPGFEGASLARAQQGVMLGHLRPWVGRVCVDQLEETLVAGFGQSDSTDFGTPGRALANDE
ncbi:hypothetical protein ERJ75_000594500 [Trypanosoma vivax]|nr:hypothetical protein ERJ75_000594500 [Trypanosoma vivax]